MSEDELVRWASARLREHGRTHEAALVETAAMQQHPSHGRPPGASATGVAPDGADLAALQAFQREEPDPAA